MLKLEKEINEMEAQRAGKRSMSNFADIEGALPKFNGDDEYGIEKWITEFEKVTKVVGCAEAEKFLYARRMMAGSAALFLRNTKSDDWQGLKNEMIAEFKKAVGAKTILKKIGQQKVEQRQGKPAPIRPGNARNSGGRSHKRV